MRVLIVEDDERMRGLLAQALGEEGYTTALAGDGEEGFSMAQTCVFDLILLDVMLPKEDGISVCRRLRQANDRTPVLMVTARDQSSEIVRGLDNGADDYITKPFSLEVILARIRALSRRGPVAHSLILRAGDLEIDTGSRAVSRRGRKIELTRTEYALLELLARNAGSVLPRERIMASVWGYGTEIESNTLDAFIRLLRNKIEPKGRPRLLKTVWGIGYSLGEAK